MQGRLISLNLLPQLFDRFDRDRVQLGAQSRRPGQDESFVLVEQVGRSQVVQSQ